MAEMAITPLQGILNALSNSINEGLSAEEAILKVCNEINETLDYIDAETAAGRKPKLMKLDDIAVGNFRLQECKQA